MTRGIWIWAGGIVLLAAAAIAKRTRAASNGVAAVPGLDLQRYRGRWHEIARYPNRFQKKCVGEVTAEYGLRADGRVDVVNRCRKADGSIDRVKGVARPDRSAGARPFATSKLEVRFAPRWLGWLPAVWGRYWVVMMDANYAWAVVSEPTRKYLWILARENPIPREVYMKITDALASRGFDTSKLQEDGGTIAGTRD